MSDLIGKKFSRFAIELFENEQLRPIYLSAGQIRVKFGAPVVHLNGDGQQGQSTVDVQIPVEPGQVFRLSSAAWSGNMAIDAATLSRLVSVKPGDLADGMKLASGWQQIELEYGHASGTVRYDVNIVEGPQYHMGELVITGLSVDAERRLRNAWRLAPGQVFDKTFLDSTLFQARETNRSDIWRLAGALCANGALAAHGSAVSRHRRLDRFSLRVKVLFWPRLQHFLMASLSRCSLC